MAEASKGSTRGGLLGRGLLLAAGALGLGGAVKRSSEAGAERPASAATELTLFGRQYHLHAPERRAGQVPQKGDRLTAYAELAERPGGSPVGDFTAAHLALDSPFAGASSIEIHSFNLADGTIHGLGSAARGADGHFVILGGTGRFAGATGSYLARRLPRELGGDGTAEFHLTLAAPEVSNGL
jgi:hypothetical protein